MNKYQKYLIDKCVVSYSLAETNKEQKCLCDEKIIITQAEDITKTKYTLRIVSGCAEKIYAIKGGIKLELHYEESPQSKIKRPLAIFSCPIDFDDRIDSIEIQFKYDVADSLMIPVVFEEADKETYYAQKAKENRNTLIKAARVKHSTGADLINIYFQPCCNEYEKSVIFLYHEETLIAKYNVDKDMFFKSISGLAYGVYYYELAQYNSNDAEIVKTDKIKVVISKPNFEFGQINVI